MGNIVREEKVSGHVTFQNRLYMGGFLFQINSQFPFDRIVWMEVGCGCGGTKKSIIKHYGVCVAGNVFYVEDRYVVETNTAIPLASQDFDKARRDQHLNPGKDFSEIVARPNPDNIWKIASEVQPKDYFKN
jgi:hypothetical protein